MIHFRSFRGRVVVLVLGLLALAQAGAFLAVSAAVTRNERARIQDELDVAGNVLARVMNDRAQRLADGARLLSGDFALKSAVSTNDAATVQSVLVNHQARAGADLMLLVSLDGRILAGAPRGRASALPPALASLLGRAEETGEASAITLVDERPYRMVVVPLLAPVPVAWIAIGYLVDDRTALDLQQLTLMNVSLVRKAADGGLTTLASTLPATPRQALPAALARGVPRGHGSVALGGDEYVTLVTPLDEGEGAVLAVLQRSLDQALEPLRHLQLTLLTLTAAAFALSLVVAAFVARRVTKPVEQLADSARRIEAGDYGHVVTVRQKDEIGALAASFNLMTRGLAERDRVRAELARVGRLKRFLAPQLAEVIVSSGAESALASHRREITVLFCDLRGFTAFAETAEPEEVMAVLREYHEAVGPLIFEYEGTLERFTGDGLMVFFNDPVPCPDPAARAVRMALAMRERVNGLLDGWRARGHSLGFGVGIALGYATLGTIGFEGRFDYAAIGSVTNLSARLCAEARDGQILVSQRIFGDVQEMVEAEPVGSLTLKGFAKPVPVHNVVTLLEKKARVGA